MQRAAGDAAEASRRRRSARSGRTHGRSQASGDARRAAARTHGRLSERRLRAGAGRYTPAGGLSPLAILAIGWAVLIIYAFPGQMTQDSFDHLREMRDGDLPRLAPARDQRDLEGPRLRHRRPVRHAPAPVDDVPRRALSLLRRSHAPRRAAWLAVAVFLFPPVMAPMAVIWKDCLMAGFLALGAAGLLSERRGRRLLGLVGMFGATAVRYNAFGATLPLVVLLFEWRPGLGWVRRYAIATAAWLATTLAAFGVNKAITDHEMHYWHSSLAIYDIVGTLSNT